MNAEVAAVQTFALFQLSCHVTRGRHNKPIALGGGEGLGRGEERERETGRKREREKERERPMDIARERERERERENFEVYRNAIRPH